MEHGTLTKEMCFPSEKTILSKIKREAKKLKIKAIFVAADNDYMIDQIENYLKNMMVL